MQFEHNQKTLLNFTPIYREFQDRFHHFYTQQTLKICNNIDVNIIVWTFLQTAAVAIVGSVSRLYVRWFSKCSFVACGWGPGVLIDFVECARRRDEILPLKRD